jgi:hypothetical protein
LCVFFFFRFRFAVAVAVGVAVAVAVAVAVTFVTRALPHSLSPHDVVLTCPGAIRWEGRHANTAFARALTRYKNAQGLGGEEDSDVTAEEKRLKEIEESKFLGGDVEHTHLVKGLDYALLQKVCATALFC